MRRSHLLILTALALILALSLLPFYSAEAGATVQGGWRCRLFPKDSNLGEILVTYESHSVDSPSGNAMIVCHFEGEVEDLHQAMHSSGFLCGTFSGTSYNSKVVITPSGQILFTCHVKHNASTTTAGGVTAPTTTSGTDGDPEISGVDTSGTGGTTSPAGDNPASDAPTTPSSGEATPDAPPPTAPNDGGSASGNCGNDNGNGNGQAHGCGNKP